ncbi:MAG: bifunctional DNA primase/polymerase, partial [Candidatus Eisenbacteria bacterium]|nr:bifunctional DNA primase/polymerase [Candidatus Eisenbacteria bacterium]
MSHPFMDDSRRYFQAGANVLPIVSGSKVPPQGIRWADWQRQRQTEQEFGQLLDAYRAADVALVLGRGSGGLVDIETDGPEGEHALRELKLPLPPTGMFESRRGVHRLYRCPRPIRSRKGLRPKLDVLASGSYVVVPTSPPRSWLTPGLLEEVTPLPEAWEEFLLRERPRLTGQELATIEREGVGDLRNVHLASLVGRWI